MSDRLKEMGFSNSNNTIHKKWVIECSRILGNRKTRCSGKFIVFTNDKIFESVAGIEV